MKKSYELTWNLKGWQDRDTMKARIKVFDADITAAGVEKPVILELDGHTTRFSLETFQFCLERGM